MWTHDSCFSHPRLVSSMPCESLLGLHTPGPGTLLPPTALANLKSSLPEGEFALDSAQPPTTPGRAGGWSRVYMYIPSASAQLPPSPFHCTGPPGRTPGVALPSCQLPSWPEPWARGQKAGAGFALFCSSDSTSLLHRFPLAPVGVGGLRKRTDLCSYFHTFPVQVGVGGSPPAYPSHLPPPPPLAG